MGEMSRRALLPALALTVTATLAGCHRAAGVVYPLTPHQARQALIGQTIPDYAFGMSAYTDPAAAAPAGVEWHVIPDSPADGRSAAAKPDRPLLVLTATVAPDPAGSRISVDVAPAPGADVARFDQAIAAKPAVRAMFVAIGVEAVDAALNHRKFAFSHIRAPTAIAMASMLPEIRQQFDRAAEADERRDRDNIDAAYGPAGAAPTATTGTVNPWK